MARVCICYIVINIVLQVPNNTCKVLRDKAALENLEQGMSNFIKDLFYLQQRETVSLVLYSRPLHKEDNEMGKKLSKSAPGRVAVEHLGPWPLLYTEL